MKKIKNISNKVDCRRLIAQVITLDNLHSIKKSFYEKIIEYLKEEDIFSIVQGFRVILILFSLFFVLL